MALERWEWTFRIGWDPLRRRQRRGNILLRQCERDSNTALQTTRLLAVRTQRGSRAMPIRKDDMNFELQIWMQDNPKAQDLPSARLLRGMGGFQNFSRGSRHE